MKYISTRGNKSGKSFADVLTSGLAPDGGLYMPDKYPRFSLKQIKSWKKFSYQELVEKIITPYIDGHVPAKDLKKIIEKSYSSFDHKKIAPVSKLFDNKYLLELYHGPTLAFKDFALQLLGLLLDYILKKQNKKITIIGATSGDTGSAAIEGCRHSKYIKIFMLHPHGRVSDVQRKQMTTVSASNVYNIALQGNFDDCQAMVKSLFHDKKFSKGKNLAAVNSINWARIMAQIVYYFYAYLQLNCPQKISFSVPTGNFGDVFAGYVARRMGLPIDRLVVATNQNDILNRFFQSNDYSKGAVKPSFSPSMDIQVSSNFERLLFDLHDNDGKKVARLMKDFDSTGKLSVDKPVLKKAQAVFDSCKINEKETLKIIQQTKDKTGKTVDPHTAVGIGAAMSVASSKNTPMVVLATAHPAKFPDAMKKAGIPSAPPPKQLKKVMGKKEKFVVLPCDMAKAIDFINKRG